MVEEDAAFIIKQLLSAITYCHSRGVVHRDLKPENILIDSMDKEGKIHIKVIDFGAALFVPPNSKLSRLFGTPYYIAPEVLKGKYNEKCDVWSIGVILYILLSGRAPFNGTTDNDIMNNVIKGIYSFKRNYYNNLDNIWKNVSETAKNLITKMLTYDPESRISASEAFKHPWFEGKDFATLTPDISQELINNINHFYVYIFVLQSSDKLQQAAMMFIASQLMRRQEKENLTKIFMALDKNGDGSLTREELLEGYTKLYKNKERARNEVESLMAIADVDNNGLIDYSEFLLATANRKEIVSKVNVKQAFDLFDIVI